MGSRVSTCSEAEMGYQLESGKLLSWVGINKDHFAVKYFLNGLLIELFIQDPETSSFTHLFLCPK